MRPTETMQKKSKGAFHNEFACFKMFHKVDWVASSFGNVLKREFLLLAQYYWNDCKRFAINLS